MEASGREQVKRDTLEKDFGHDVEVKEHGKQINASNTLEKDLDHDVEEKVHEQKQATTISTLEKDLAHGCEDSKLVDDDKVEKGKKARAGSVFKFTAEEEYIGGGGGDSFGASCWFD